VSALVDNSVWQRLTKRGVLDELASLLEHDSIVTTTPQILEFCHSTRNGSEHDLALADQSTFTRLQFDDECHHIALQIQSSLWHGGRVRAAGAFDIMIAAVAHRHGATVVHYDSDFATIGEVLDGFQHRWIAPQGSLD
jgi:predicted nucleic acid-binding protein